MVGCAELVRHRSRKAGSVMSGHASSSLAPTAINFFFGNRRNKNKNMSQLDQKFTNKAASEKRNLPPVNSKEVWVIDDNKAMIDSCFRAWKSDLEELNFSFKHFERASDALEEIKKRIENEKILPGVILVDGNLDLDETELQDGIIVVKKIKDMADNIKLIGFSGDRFQNEKMLEKGAETAFSKMEALKVRQYLKNLAEENKNQEK